MTIQCGRCIGCRLDYSREWAIRCYHESKLYDDNCFVTLTYRDPNQCTLEQLAKREHIRDDYSLQKSHFQKFLKRLRKKADAPFRYFMCGEYGELGRPHYHVCLFNYQPSDLQHFYSVEGLHYYTSEELLKTWKYGHVTVTQFTWETAAYTARYSLKKVHGEKADEHYRRVRDDGTVYWLLPEYSDQSNRPGIGAEFAMKYMDDFTVQDKCHRHDGGAQQMPRYYLKLLERSDPEQLEKILELRRQKNAERA